MEIPKITQYNTLFQGEAVCAWIEAVCTSCLHPQQEEVADLGIFLVLGA
jgi:hypothetical protein